jgi:tape measure domain-containing protein
MADNKVEIKVTADAAQAVVGLGQVGSTIDALSGKQGAVATAATQSADKQVSASNRVRESVAATGEQLDNLKNQLLGLVGIGVGTQAIKDLAALTDSYKNLEARIKLTTGEGKAFDTAFEGVFAVAKRTSSAVEETGMLFTKLAEAGKALGVTQSEALKLTETINQSIQLSGGSAESAKASIVQLIQGLQSGVLRGDEFNSVMEQSPRLAKAMSDGLGITTSELRKMAEEGRLTSATVISSLQKQADVIDSEFTKLPQTVGRSMQNLSTEFTKFIGETDKAHGYSTTLAKGIELLANNLTTVASAMLHAGQVFAAYKALNLAADFLGFNAAVQASTVATTQNTAATATNTVAKQTSVVTTTEQAAASARAAGSLAFLSQASAANTVVTNTNTAAQVSNALAVEAGGKASAAAAAGAGIFGGGLAAITRAFAPLALLDIALSFKNYGTAIGEAAAKLIGYKDRTDEIAKSEKLAAAQAEELATARKRQAAADKDAADARFGLTKRGAELVANFDELIKKGDSANEAIGKIGKDFDLAKVAGIKDATAVLDKLLADGKLTASEFKKAWSDALKGADLAVFETQARAALSGTAREAERLAQMLDATLREAVKRTGLDFDVISGGMGKAARSAINDTDAIVKGLDSLKKQGVDTGQALAASIGKSINAADSKPAIDAVRAQIESLRTVLGHKITDGFLDQAKLKANELADALDKAKPGVNSLREAMAELGMKSRDELQATASKATAAFDTIKVAGQQEGESYAGWQARKADAAKVMLDRIIAANGGIATEAVKTRAAMEGLELSVDSVGKTTVRAMADGKKGVDDLSASFRSAGDAADDMARHVAAAAAIADKYGAPKGGSVTGNNRDERLAGQAATDGSGAFALRAKQRAGTLSGADLQTAEAVLAAAEFNKRMLEKNATAYSIEGTLSVFEELNSAKMILEEVKRKAGTAQPGAGNAGTAAPAAANSTYVVKLDFGNGSVQNVNVASANDAQVLIGALQQARSAAGF